VSLSALASEARATEEQRIYTAADRDVTPPRPLGHQLPIVGLPGVSSPVTGRLRILVDRSGQVETVIVDTPANGFHDRMIVSAAKAWRYKPALRNGKPVRFSLVMPLNLPDS
jgi:TonB family protein